MSAHPQQDPAAAVTGAAAAMVGRSYRLPDYYEVGREKIREFARAVQDPHPAHNTVETARSLGYAQMIAPITFTAILGSLAQRYIFEHFLTEYDMSQVLHTDQRFVVHRPVQVGDRLVCDVSLETFRQGHGQDVFVFKNVISNQPGGLVQTNWITTVARSGGVVDDDIARVVNDIITHNAR